MSGDSPDNPERPNPEYHIGPPERGAWRLYRAINGRAPRVADFYSPEQEGRGIMEVARPFLGTERDIMKSVSMFTNPDRLRRRRKLAGKRIAQVDVPAEATQTGEVRIRQGGADPAHYEVWADRPEWLLECVTGLLH